MVGDGRVCAPISALPCLSCLGPAAEAKIGRRAQMQISHHGDPCLRWYAGHLYTNQKMCYLMEGSPNSRPTSTVIWPKASSKDSNLCPGNMPKKCARLFYLPARAILAFASLCMAQMFCWLRPGFEPLYWNCIKNHNPVLLLGELTSLSLLCFVFSNLNRTAWYWCLSLLSKGFQKELPVCNESPKLQQFDFSNRCLWLLDEMDLILWKPSLCEALIHLWWSVFQYILIK